MSTAIHPSPQRHRQPATAWPRCDKRPPRIAPSRRPTILSRRRSTSGRGGVACIATTNPKPMDSSISWPDRRPCAGTPRTSRRAPFGCVASGFDAPLDGLPTGLDGLRIGFLSDTHHAPGRPLTMLARGITLLHAASPDLILHGGDYVADHSADFAPCAALLGQLRAPLGVYGVYGTRLPRSPRKYQRTRRAACPDRPSLLRNESVRLSTPGGAPSGLSASTTPCAGTPTSPRRWPGRPATNFASCWPTSPSSAHHLGGRRIH